MTLSALSSSALRWTTGWLFTSLGCQHRKVLLTCLEGSHLFACRALEIHSAPQHRHHYSSHASGASRFQSFPLPQVRLNLWSTHFPPLLAHVVHLRS
jgi:hypothetical protein